MKKIALAAAALLIAAGSAYARNDNVGGSDINKQEAVNVDTTHTASIRKNDAVIRTLLNQGSAQQQPAGGNDPRDIFGNR